MSHEIYLNTLYNALLELWLNSPNSNTFSGLTVNGNLTITGATTSGSLSATTISATTYYGLPIDVVVTGGTYSSGTAIFTNNTGGTFNVTGFSTGTDFTGGTVTGATNFTGGLTANTISATTISGVTYYGDGSQLTGIVSGDFLPISGGTVTGQVNFSSNVRLTGGTVYIPSFYTDQILPYNAGDIEIGSTNYGVKLLGPTVIDGSLTVNSGTTINGTGLTVNNDAYFTTSNGQIRVNLTGSGNPQINFNYANGVNQGNISAASNNLYIDSGSGNVLFRGTAGIVTTHFNNGQIKINDQTGSANNAQLEINNNSTSRVGLIINGIAGQTANLQEWQRTGTTLAYITSGANLFLSGITTNGTGATFDFGAGSSVKILKGNYAAIYLNQSSPSDGVTSNYALLGSGNDTYLNTPLGGRIYFANNGNSLGDAISQGTGDPRWTFNLDVRPAADNTWNNGTAAYRWKAIHTVALSASTVSATTYYGDGSQLTGVGASTFSGGTITGPTDFTNGLTATSISATTYLNLPTDVRVTGGTYSSGTATFTNNTGGTFSVSGFSTSTGGSFTGGTVTGATEFTAGVTSNTISATTLSAITLTFKLYSETGSTSTYNINGNNGNYQNLTFNSATTLTYSNMQVGLYNIIVNTTGSTLISLSGSSGWYTPAATPIGFTAPMTLVNCIYDGSRMIISSYENLTLFV